MPTTKRKSKQATSRTRRRGRPASGVSSDTKSALLAAARELLTERGAGYVSLAEVAKRADVDPAMINYNFGGRDPLFSAVIAQVIEEWIPAAQEIADLHGDAADRLEQRLRALIAMRRQAPFIDRLMLEQIMVATGSEAEEQFRGYMAEAIEQYEKLLEDGVQQGRLRPVDPTFLFISGLALCDYFFSFKTLLKYVADVDGNDNEIVAKYAQHVVDLILYGVIGRPSDPDTETTEAR